MTVKFGVRLPVSGPLASPEGIQRIGLKAEELGFDAITTHDHVLHNYEGRYHNCGGVGEMVDERDKAGLPVTNLYETMTGLSFLAGRTKNVRLIPCAIALPWRHPVLFAKEAVTLHELSDGRFVACVCIGNIRSDFDATGVDFKSRGKIFDEYMEVLNLILSPQKQISYDGRFIKLPPSEFYPKPSSKIPIWIAGQFIDRVFERVVKYGDGFLPMADPETFRTGLTRLDDAFRKNGIARREIEVGTQTFMCLMEDGAEARRRSRYTIESFYHGTEYNMPDPNNPSRTRRQAMMAGTLQNALVGSPDEIIAKIESYVTAGVNFFDIRQVNRNLEDVIGQLELFAREVTPSFS